jgi:hypothetical protein
MFCLGQSCETIALGLWDGTQGLALFGGVFNFFQSQITNYQQTFCINSLHSSDAYILVYFVYAPIPLHHVCLLSWSTYAYAFVSVSMRRLIYHLD